MPVIEVNEKILLVERRLFREDMTRFFVGVVKACDGFFIRASGYTYFIDPYQVGGVGRRVEERERLVSLLSEAVVYVLPANVEIADVQLKCSPKTLFLTDNKTLQMDLSEWLYRG